MKKRTSQFKKEEFRINDLSFPDLVLKQTSSKNVLTNTNYLNKLVDTPLIKIQKITHRLIQFNNFSCMILFVSFCPYYSVHKIMYIMMHIKLN